MPEVQINPPAHALGRVNAVLNGRAMRGYESRFAGPLSVKAVMEGRAVWETDDGRFELVPGSALLLNDGEEYTVTADALQPVETFCFFFERGFVEDAFRATTTGSAALLDAPQRTPAIAFFEKLHFDSPLVAELANAHARLRCGERLGASFYAVAIQLVRAQAGVAASVARLPSMRAATREELARRLGIATSFLHANCERDVTVAEASRAACLSPFHFHRLFTRFHGVTPHRYLNRLRLERARAILRSSERSVIDVAADCGFNSLGSFTTLYKRTFGTTPGAAKKQESRNAAERARPTMPS